MSTPISRALVDRIGECYGSQELFEEKTAATVASTVQILKKRTPDPQFCFQLLESLWMKRAEVAGLQGTRDSKEFGLPRYGQSDLCMLGSKTKVEEKFYGYYEKVLVDSMRYFLDQMTGSTLITKRAKSTIVVERYDRKRYLEEVHCGPEQTKELEEKIGGDKSIQEITTNPETLAQFHESAPQLFTRAKLSAVLAEMDPEYRLIIERDLVCIQHFVEGEEQLCWVGLIDQRGELSQLRVVHQDPPKISKTVEHIAELFSEVLQFHGPIEELRQMVAKLRWLYASCMPCHRGDGAVGDWLELIIYSYHGYQAAFNQSFMPNVEPLVLALDDYCERYRDLITTV
ncbi:MAG: hypothetical protein S4CHLAM81_00890 [Chlamydiales bacterium]|nr:hypothetical protein [Chlamydiales bacterium]MCH9634885.1 hypothetical protein [Chlamydiales bacterium]MCH9703702.1 hypothetical protein [Chlamydiota bacterium]